MWASDRGPITHHHPDTSRASLRSGKYNNSTSGLTTPSQGQRRGARFTTSPNLGDIHYLIPPETGVFRFVTPRLFCWWLGVRCHRIGDNVLSSRTYPLSRKPTPCQFNFLISRVWKFNGAEQWGKSNSLKDRIPPTDGHRLYRQSLCISTANQVEMPRFQLETSRCLAWEWISQ